MFSRWKLLLLTGYPKSSWWRSALACCGRSLHLGKDGKLNPCLYFLRIRGISTFCGISPFPRSQSGCRTREILASSVSAIRTLPSGYHCQEKKFTLRQNLKNTPKQLAGIPDPILFIGLPKPEFCSFCAASLHGCVIWALGWSWFHFFWLKCAQNYKSMCKTEDAALE